MQILKCAIYTAKYTFNALMICLLYIKNRILTLLYYAFYALIIWGHALICSYYAKTEDEAKSKILRTAQH